MSYRALTIDQLVVSPFNVRKDPRALTPASIEAMAKSLLEHGQIMPLVVHPMKGNKGKFGVFAGQRRYLGLKKLISDGKLLPDHPIDTMIREAESEAELIALSTAENVVRRDLYAYETYAALARAIRRGLSHEELAQTLGQDSDWVKRGVRLGMLAEPIFKAYADDQLTLDCAKAFAATEDTKLQLVAFEAFRKLPQHEQVRRSVHQLLKVGDRELTKLLLFVGEEPYRAARGRFELDLFAEESEFRGLVRDEGLLRELADAKLEQLRARLRARAGRDLRFAAEPPKNGFDMVDRSLQIAPAEAALSPEDEARLVALKVEQADLEERSRAYVDDAGTQLPGTEAAIAEIDAIYVPNEAEIAAIEDKRPLNLPAGDIFATIEIDETGDVEVRYWWKDHRALSEASGSPKASPKPASPSKSTAVATAPAKPTAAPAGDRPIEEGAAIVRSNNDDWTARDRADRRLRDAFGLTSEGVQAMRNLRRDMLRTQLLQDDLDGGTVARDYLVFAQLRMLLTKARPAQVGMRPFVWLGPVELREEAAGAELLEHCSGGLFAEQLDRVRSWRCFTLPDIVLAFENYLALDDGMKSEATALLACLILERSLDADGYRVALHDRVALQTGMGGDAQLRGFSAFRPAAAFFNLFSKEHRLELAIPFVGRDAVASWSKRRSGEQNDLVAKIFTSEGAETLTTDLHVKGERWVHPLLSFNLEHADAEREAAE